MFSVMPPFAAEKPSRNSSLMEFSLQALLVRHEAYMADAEKERKEQNENANAGAAKKDDVEIEKCTIFLHLPRQATN